MIKIEERLREVIRILDFVLGDDETIMMIGEREEVIRLWRRLLEAKKMIGREKMEEWQKAITRTYDILHFLNIKNI